MFNLFEKEREGHPEIFYFILILIGIYVLWLISGGPERASQHKDDKFQRPLAPLDSGNTYDEPLLSD